MSSRRHDAEDRYWEEDLPEQEPTQVISEDQPLDHEPTRVLDPRDQDRPGRGTGHEERTQVLDGPSTGRDDRTQVLDGRSAGRDDRTQVLEDRSQGTDWERQEDDAPYRSSPYQSSASTSPAGASTAHPAGTGAPEATTAWPGAQQYQEPSGSELRTRVVRRQKERYGRVQMLPGLFGWLVGLAVIGLLLTGAQRFAGGLGITSMPAHPATILLDLNGTEAGTGPALGWGLALVVCCFIGFLVGGIAAGRAARFSGAKQGLGLFWWAVIAALVATALNLVFGFTPDSTPFPVSAQALGGSDLLSGALGALGTAVIALVAGTLGGLWGTAFHRRADRWGFEER